MTWLIAKMAVRNISGRKGQAALIVIGLMICSAVITGSLVVGDSMEYLVYSSTFENLGDVDIVIRAGEFYDYSYYSVIAQNTSINNVIDKHAPIILLPSSIKAEGSGLRENKANIIGFNEEFLTFGNFYQNGKKLDIESLALGKKEIIINEHLASKLELKVNENVTIFINNPGFALETVYSTGQGLNSIEFTMTVKYIVKNQGLGRLQLDGRTVDTSNIFVNLTQLQKLLKIGNKINTILISNRGDKFTGIDRDQSVVTAVSESLDFEIGYQELGLELNSTGSQYLRLVNDDVFFDQNIYGLMEEYEQEYNNIIVTSPVFTYFVNSIKNNENNRVINYSMITGLNFTKDNLFGDFEIINSDSNIEPGGDINLGPGEIVLIDWAKERLDVNVGEIVTVEYMALDRLYNIYNTTTEFTVKYVISLTGKAIDPQLMPAFPGLKDEPDCVNWEPPFPIDLDRIIRSDQNFWFDYRGTPKAYITLDQAQALWGTNLGSLTMVKLNVTSNKTSGSTTNQDLVSLQNNVSQYLDIEFGYSDAGFIIDRVKSDALATAIGMAIFSMMFLTFSSVIILAGMVLIVTIFLILAETRKYDFGVGRALGMSQQAVLKTYLFEGIIYALFAGIIGVIFGILIGWVLVSALNSIWSSAVQEYAIPFYFKPLSLVLGFFAGFIITVITIYFTAYHLTKQNIVSALYDLPTTAPKHGILHGLNAVSLILIVIGTITLILDFSDKLNFLTSIDYYLRLLGPVLLFIGSGLLGYQMVKNIKTKRHVITITGFSIIIYLIIYSLIVFPIPAIPTVELFFLVGLLLVLTTILVIVPNLNAIANALIYITSVGRNASPVAKYSLQNPTRRLTRTGLIMGMFALVIFLLAAFSINIAIQQASVDIVSDEERGGYDIIGESAVPISIDLENPSQRNNNNLNAPVLDNVSITEIKMVGPPGGTCSNMNVRYPPRLLGVAHEFIIENRFSFMNSRSNSNKPRDTWMELEQSAEQNNGKIPIVVDYNTLVWIYNGGLGHVYEIEAESGETVELEVIGVLENTVFGGTFIMSQKNLDKLYPESAEYRYFLFRLKPEEPTPVDQVADDLELALNNFGLDAQPINDLIKENRAYERSFMALFQAFLGLGLIIGVIGLGVVTARAAQERRFEIGVLRAIGFTKKMILKSFLIELSFIGLLAIVLGLIVGILSSYLAFGAWTGGNYSFVLPWVDLLILAICIYLVTLISAIFPIYKAAKISPAKALQRIG